MRRRHPMGLVATVLATLAAIFLTTLSSAATAETSIAEKEYNTVPICFGYEVNADGARLAQAPGTPEGCYSSRAAAAKVYGKAGIATDFTFGQAWDRKRFGGNRLDLVVANNQAYCGDRRHWGWSWLGQWNWNDRIRSIKSYGTCSAQLFQDINYQPARDFFVCGQACEALPWAWSATASSLILRVF